MIISKSNNEIRLAYICKWLFTNLAGLSDNQILV